jgi:L-threonylcarbamoyladenylate synthase
LKTEVLPFDKPSIIRIAKFLTLDEVVALPTETVYGLAGNAFRDQAVQKIFLAKERPAFDPLIVHISERYLTHPKGLIPALVQDGILAPEILASPELKRIHAAMKKYWPGPLTFILPRGEKIPDSVTASQPTVGIRCPSHPAFQAVLNNVSFPLAAPSANRFGKISPTETKHVMSELSGRIPAILEGGICEVGVESTILKIDFPFQVILLRPGKISLEELSETFQMPITQGQTMGEAHPQAISPGSLDEHYAPNKSLFLFPGTFSDQKKLELFFQTNPMPKNLGWLSMQKLPNPFSFSTPQLRVLSQTNDIAEMAHSLFKSLRELDSEPEIQAILCDLPNEYSTGLGAAIADRLRRASRNKPQI